MEFYFTIKLEEVDKKEIINCITEDNYACALNVLTRKIIPNNNIPLGVLEDGMKFMFYGNKEKYYSLTRKSINEFLNQPNIIIHDEDGNRIETSLFWTIVTEANSGKDYAQKYAENAEKSKWWAFSEPITTPYDTYKPKCGEFYNDGLRFSVYN